MTLSDRLKEITDSLRSGGTPSATTGRDLLTLFGARRRGWRTAEQIEEQLRAAGLTTEPPFSEAYLNAPLVFKLMASIGVTGTIQLDGVTAAGSIELDPLTDQLSSVAVRLTPRLGQLAAANRSPVCVSPDASLLEATTLMIQHGYSQLPLIQGTREVRGLLSWTSLGTATQLGAETKTAKDAASKDVHILAASIPLIDATPLIIANEVVLVKAADGTIQGIVTTTDLAQEFQALTEPFILLSEIENLIRAICSNRYVLEELRTVRDNNNRPIESLADFTFGEYVRLLENATRWEKSGIKLERRAFIKALDEVREIRNDVMHFDPEPLDDKQLVALRKFRSMLQQVHDHRAA